MIYIVLPTQLHPEQDNLYADESVSFYYAGGRIRHFDNYEDAREEAIELSEQDRTPCSVFKFDTCLEAADHREIFLP